MVYQRIFYGALLIGVVALVGWGDVALSERAASAPALNLQHGSAIPFAVVIVALVGALEGLALCRKAGIKPLSGAVLLGVAAITLATACAPLHAALGPLGAGTTRLAICAIGVMVICGGQVLRGQSEGGLANISGSTFIFIYMGLLPSFLIDLRTGWSGAGGVWVLVLFLATVKCTDIGAYFTGLAMGRTKLIPHISPGKTVEGLVGGMIAAAAVAMVLSRTTPLPAPLGLGTAALFGALLAVIGQTGDLVESILKREAGAKDSSNLIPTFGGLLDLLDSPAFAAPVAAVLLKAWLS